MNLGIGKILGVSYRSQLRLGEMRVSIHPVFTYHRNPTRYLVRKPNFSALGIFSRLLAQGERVVVTSTSRVSNS